jgi:hypothetical protein
MMAVPDQINYEPLENYLAQVSHMDVATQYLAANGEVKSRCYLGRLFRWIGLGAIVRLFCSESIEKAKDAFTRKVEEYQKCGSSRLPRAKRIQLVLDAHSRVNFVTEYVYKKRGGEARGDAKPPLFDLAEIMRRWQSDKSRPVQPDPPPANGITLLSSALPNPYPS